MGGIKSMQAADGFSVCRHALGGDECQSVLGRCQAPCPLRALPPLYIRYSVSLVCKAPPSAIEGYKFLNKIAHNSEELLLPTRGIISFTCDAQLLFQVRMGTLKRKRAEAPRVPTLEDVHPYTTWSMCVRVYHKFHTERFAVGRKRLSMVLLDEKGKKMAAVIYDDEVDRFEPLLVEGRVYYVWRMSAEPVMRNQDYMFADSHFVCRFTSVTAVHEIRNVNEQFIPLFPPFMPFDKVWQFTLDNDMYVDVIGMVLYVSSMGQKCSFYNRKVLVRNIVLMDSSYNIVKLVVWDKLVIDNLSTWEKIVEERAIVVATMLRAKRYDRGLHTTDFSRVYFNPEIAIASELHRSINNELSGPHTP